MSSPHHLALAAGALLCPLSPFPDTISGWEAKGQQFSMPPPVLCGQLWLVALCPVVLLVGALPPAAVPLLLPSVSVAPLPLISCFPLVGTSSSSFWKVQGGRYEPAFLEITLMDLWVWTSRV